MDSKSDSDSPIIMADVPRPPNNNNVPPIREIQDGLVAASAEDVITTLQAYGLVDEGMLYNDRDPMSMRSYLNAYLTKEDSFVFKKLAVVSGHRGVNFAEMPKKSKDEKAMQDLIGKVEAAIRTLVSNNKPPFELNVKTAVFSYPEFMYAGASMAKDQEVVQKSNPVSMILGNTTSEYESNCKRFAETRKIEDFDGFWAMRKLQANSIKSMSKVMDKSFVENLQNKYAAKYKLKDSVVVCAEPGTTIANVSLLNSKQW